MYIFFIGDNTYVLAIMTYVATIVDIVFTLSIEI